MKQAQVRARPTLHLPFFVECFLSMRGPGVLGIAMADDVLPMFQMAGFG